MQKLRSVVIVSIGILVIFSTPPSYAQRKVFNDDRPETKAIELWRITHDPKNRHHTIYHDSNPFSPTGRYMVYVLTEDKLGKSRSQKTSSRLVVYDLMFDKEIWRSPYAGSWPVWARRSDRIFWSDGTKGHKQNVWQVEIPSGALTKICEDAYNDVTGISHDDEWLFYTHKNVFRIRTRPGAKSEFVWQHPDTQNVSSSLLCHNPAHPVFQVRQNINLQFRWSKKYPPRMLVTDEGRMLGPAIAGTEKAHGAWRGDGAYLITGDDLIGGRKWNEAYPSPLLTYSNTPAHDPSPCGNSGQWVCSTDGINDCLKVFDWRTTDTTLVCYSASIIHQPLGDDRDLSGAYDSDAYGSPDGTKIAFSTNYQLDQFPVTQITKDSSSDVLDVMSTAGFADKGYLSVHAGVISYSSKTETSFNGIKKGALGSRLAPLKKGFSVSNFFGRTDEKADNPLNKQFSTDVYIAVWKLPDSPTLVLRDKMIVMYPGFNHRETRGYLLYVDGKQINEKPWCGEGMLGLPDGEELHAVSVEWSGLKSKPSNSILLNGIKLLSYANTPPEDLNTPIITVLIDREGKKIPAPPGMALKDISEAILQYVGNDDTLLTEEIYRSGQLMQKVEYTPDGRSALIMEYQNNLLFKRIVKDPQGNILRIEYLDNEGLLTLRDHYSGDNLVERIEYENGEPSRRIIFYENQQQIVQLNTDGYWTKLSDADEKLQ